MSSRGRRLGRGLGALFPTIPEADDTKPQPDKANTKAEDNAVAAESQQSQMKQSLVDHSDKADQSAAAAQSAGVGQQAKSDQKAAAGQSGLSEQQTQAKQSGEAEQFGVSEHQSVGEHHSVAEQQSSTHVSRETTSSRKSAPLEKHHSSRKRPTMPSLQNAVSPLDSIFGPSPTETQAAASQSGESTESKKLVGASLFTGDGSTQQSNRTSAGSVTLGTSSAVTGQQDDAGVAVVKEPLREVNGWYLTELNVHDIAPNKKQPRTVFDEDDLDELSRSIKEVGVLQPIVVRAKEAGHTQYELIMGERRWRASQRAGLETIPAIVRATSDAEMLREALLENLQRVALNPLEEAAAYQQMLDEFGITQAELSKSVSKSRPQIANTLRLLQLPASVQKRVASGVISAGHARALLSLGDEEQMEALANRIVAEGLSVRSTEEIVSMQSQKKDNAKRRKTSRNIWSGTETLQRLEDHFNTKVMIRGTKKRGKIEINFASEEDLDRILQLLNTQQSNQADESEWK